MNIADDTRDLFAQWLAGAYFWLCLISGILAGYFGQAARDTYILAWVAVALAPLIFIYTPSKRLFVFALAPMIGLFNTYGPNRFLAYFLYGYLASAVVLVFRSIVMARRATANPPERALSNGELQAGTTSAVRHFPAITPRHDYAAVVGMDDTKRALLERAREIVQCGKGESPRNGILLSGDPGNGKTYFAEALAGELKLPFLAISYGELASRWINQTTENVVALFASARRQAPCVLFIDEIDSLIPDRGQIASADSEVLRTVNTVLTELVNIRGSGVVVVGATNHLDRLDPAAIREGRFDFKVEIPAPDLAARKHLITQGLARQLPDLSIQPRTVDTAATRWSGFSVVRINAILREAAGRARRDGLATLDLDHLQQALRTVQGRKGRLPESTPGLADLALNADQKSRLSGIANRMRNIEQLEALGGTVPTGLLFYGPPGTGKTLTARALARESNWAFLPVAGHDILADPGRIDTLLREARELRPCIVFIDEADDILADRGLSAARSVTNKLLTAMDGAGGRSPDVLFIAATNHLEQIDNAALRGGRFTEKLFFALPDRGVIARYITTWFKQRDLEPLAPLTIEDLAQKLEGAAIADVQAVLQEAVNGLVSRQLTSQKTAGLGIGEFKRAMISVLGGEDSL